MEQEINAAVSWWAEQLRSPSSHKTGDANNDAVINFYTMTRPPLMDEQIDRFTTTLNATLGARASVEDDLLLSTDYAPEEILEDVANEVGIPHVHFPMKTVMWIYPGFVQVRHGYGASPKTIYQTIEK